MDRPNPYPIEGKFKIDLTSGLTLQLILIGMQVNLHLKRPWLTQLQAKRTVLQKKRHILHIQTQNHLTTSSVAAVAAAAHQPLPPHRPYSPPHPPPPLPTSSLLLDSDIFSGAGGYSPLPIGSAFSGPMHHQLTPPPMATIANKKLGKNEHLSEAEAEAEIAISIDNEFVKKVQSQR